MDPTTTDEATVEERRPSRLWFVRLALVLVGAGVRGNQAIVRSRWHLPEEWTDATRAIYERGEDAMMDALQLSVPVAFGLTVAFAVLAVIAFFCDRPGAVLFDTLATLVCVAWLCDAFMTLAVGFT